VAEQEQKENQPNWGFQTTGWRKFRRTE